VTLPEDTARPSIERPEYVRATSADTKQDHRATPGTLDNRHANDVAAGDDDRARHDAQSPNHNGVVAHSHSRLRDEQATEQQNGGDGNQRTGVPVPAG
jgi:hypothetical protein